MRLSGPCVFAAVTLIGLGSAIMTGFVTMNPLVGFLAIVLGVVAFIGTIIDILEDRMPRTAEQPAPARNRAPSSPLPRNRRIGGRQ